MQGPQGSIRGRGNIFKEKGEGAGKWVKGFKRNLREMVGK
jgi:hypothetical protein